MRALHGLRAALEDDAAQPRRVHGREWRELLGHVAALRGDARRQLDAAVHRDDPHGRQAERQLLLDPQADEVAGCEPARVAQHVPPALEVPDRAADRDDPDRHLEEAEHGHGHAVVADGEQHADGRERDVHDAQTEDENRPPGTGEEGIQGVHRSMFGEPVASFCGPADGNPAGVRAGHAIIEDNPRRRMREGEPCGPSAPRLAGATRPAYIGVGARGHTAIERSAARSARRRRLTERTTPAAWATRTHTTT